MSKYNIKVNSVVILPQDAELFDERATFVSVSDEGAGMFFIINQYNDRPEPGEIRLDGEELALLSEAFHKLMDDWKEKFEVDGEDE